MPTFDLSLAVDYPAWLENRFVRIRENEKRPYEDRWQHHGRSRLDITLHTGNVGVLLRGMTEVDLDLHDNNQAEIEEIRSWLESAYPTAPLMRSQGGGYKFFFRGETSTRQIRWNGSHLVIGQLRSGAATALVPPSQIEGRHYEWVRVDYAQSFEDLPTLSEADELRLAGTVRKKATVEQSGFRQETFKDGGRNVGLSRHAGLFRRFGYSETEIYSLLQAVNQERCSPPLPESELLQIASGFMRYSQEAEIGVGAGDLIVSPAELLNLPPAKWKYEGLIPEYGIGQLYGESGGGKTFLGLHAAYCYTNGLPLMGKEPVGEPGSAVYVATEGKFDMAERVRAWRDANPDCSIDNVFFIFAEDRSLNLAKPEDLEWVEQEIIYKVPTCGLIIIDTQSQAFGIDENSNSEFNTLVANPLKQLSSFLKAFILLVHHIGHSGDHARGNSSQRPSMDVQLYLTKNDAGVHTVKVTKMKAARDGDKTTFALKPQGKSLVCEFKSEIASVIDTNDNVMRRCMREADGKARSDIRSKRTKDHLEDAKEQGYVVLRDDESGGGRPRQVWTITSSGRDFLDGSVQ